MVFEKLCLVKGVDMKQSSKTTRDWYKLVFAKTDFAAYDLSRLQIELEEFYDFAVLDFLEILGGGKKQSCEDSIECSLLTHAGASSYSRG